MSLSAGQPAKWKENILTKNRLNGRWSAWWQIGMPVLGDCRRDVPMKTLFLPVLRRTSCLGKYANLQTGSIGTNVRLRKKGRIMRPFFRFLSLLWLFSPKKQKRKKKKEREREIDFAIDIPSPLSLTFSIVTVRCAFACARYLNLQEVLLRVAICVG